MRFITLVPLLALCTTGCAGLAVRAVAGAHQPHADQMFENADANGDGRISRSEFMAARDRAFTRLDRDGDGYLTSADAPRGLRARGGGQGGQGGQGALMRAMDADGDGRISREEFVNGSLRVFDRTDANHDGVVDAQELAAFHAAAARRGQ
jgi:Ca2+-binding EF-hand superfamily protein